MTYIIIYHNQEDTCCIVHPAPEMFDPNSKTRGLLDTQGIRLETDEDVLSWIIQKDVPKGVKYRVSDTSKLPSDRVFRGAWTDKNDTETVDIDIIKAREIQLNSLRKLRNEKLIILDTSTIKALGKNDLELNATIETQKQELRDMPITATAEMKNITTPEELKAYLPSILVS